LLTIAIKRSQKKKQKQYDPGAFTIGVKYGVTDGWHRLGE
jgi:hypothetical protein